VPVSRTAPVRVVAKVGHLLDVLAEEGEPTVGRLSERVDEPRSSIYRLLSSLQSCGLIEPGASRGTYRLGFKMVSLGAAVVARFDVRTAALPAMEDLHQRTGETVFLCVRRGDDAVCIERLDGTRVNALALQIGGGLQLHVGAASRVLLAYAGEQEWKEYLDRTSLTRLTPFSLMSKRAVTDALRETISTGFAVSDQDVTVGIAALGAPVFGHGGSVEGAISIAGVRDSILAGARAKVASQLSRATAAASRELGFRPAG
jgi:DNA-binding IclR family transcriptional regulator